MKNAHSAVQVAKPICHDAIFTGIWSRTSSSAARLVEAVGVKSCWLHVQAKISFVEPTENSFIP